MKTYVALLRGINVGGNKKVPMAVLKKTLEGMGYKNVATLLASGNVIFDSTQTDKKTLTATLEKELQKKFGFTIPVILRTLEEIRKLKKADPFKGISVTPDTRLYVTFVGEKPKSTLKIPYKDPVSDYRILSVLGTDVCSVLVVDENAGSVDAMKILEKEFGKNITTRNWNTVEKILACGRGG